MADLSVNPSLPGVGRGESNVSAKSGPRAPSGAGTEISGAFNTALAQNTSSSKGPGGALGSEGSTRLGVNLAASTSIGRGDAGGFDLPVLQLGAADRTVGLLQRALALLGNPALPADNLFGARTDQAVRSFQNSQGLARDGVVGNRQTWPAINQALITRHEGVARLADAMGPVRSGESKVELNQLTTVLAAFGERTAPPVTTRETAGEVAYTVRGGETLADVARTFGLPVSALIAANPELTKPYLILQGQLLIVPNPVKERRYRRPSRQLHAADPEGHLASAYMNPGFVALVNGMIGQLRGEGYDVRVLAGYRSFAEQQQRFDQGRHVPGAVLTDAGAGHSWHNYGLAVDIVLNDEDGRPAWPEDSSIFWQRLGDVALAQGAVWGGLFGYPAHVEYHPQFEREEAGSLIEDFESHGLDVIWERIALELPPPEA